MTVEIAHISGPLLMSCDPSPTRAERPVTFLVGSFSARRADLAPSPLAGEGWGGGSRGTTIRTRKNRRYRTSLDVRHPPTPALPRKGGGSQRGLAPNGLEGKVTVTQPTRGEGARSALRAEKEPTRKVTVAQPIATGPPWECRRGRSSPSFKDGLEKPNGSESSATAVYY